MIRHNQNTVVSATIALWRAAATLTHSGWSLLVPEWCALGMIGVVIEMIDSETLVRGRSEVVGEERVPARVKRILPLRRKAPREALPELASEQSDQPEDVAEPSVVVDSVANYLREIAKIPRITPKQEIELAKRIEE